MSITVFGEGRGFRVVWLLEEMGVPYRLRPVDLLAGSENDPEFLAVNPAGFIPALVDDDVIMVESIAIMQYLVARYGPTPLAPGPHEPGFPLFQQFLHLGEAGLMGFLFFVFADRVLAPEEQRNTWTGDFAHELFESRRRLVIRQLSRSPYMAGRTFTAADISVTYALEFGQRTVGIEFDDAEQAYLERTTAREAYARAMAICKDTTSWVTSLTS